MTLSADHGQTNGDNLPTLEGYVFAYFTGDTIEGEQIYLAASNGNNALDWKALNGGQPVLTSTRGTRGLRDPFLIRSASGDSFYLLATDLSIGSGTTWEESQRTGSTHIEVWESTDLITWSEQRHVRVSDPRAGNTWAPEAVFDETIGAYVVFWASKLYDEDDVEHAATVPHSMFYATTTDFVTFTEPQPWQTPDGSVIDSTVLKVGSTYHRFTKDEGSVTGCADIIHEQSAHLRTPSPSPNWTTVASCIGLSAGTDAVEGPIAFRSNPADENGEAFYLFVDEYGGRGYVPLFTSDITTPRWQLAATHRLPTNARHGSVLPVTGAEHGRLLTLLS